MGYIRCEKHKDTLLASRDSLLEILPAVLTDPHIDIWKIEKCDAGGWHIFFEMREFNKKGEKNGKT